MPGRLFTALTVPGGSVSGTTQVNGFTVPVDLALSSRSGDQPTQYVATRTIDLDEGFESGDNDDVTAYLTDTSYAGTGNGGSGADGVAGASKYRFGFNGKEKDTEVKGIADQIDYGMRVYDPRGATFLSIDPLQKQYPWYSPYQFAGRSPIANVDRDGQEEYHYSITLNSQGKTFLTQGRTEEFNHHSLFGFKWDTKIANERYVVTFGKNTYYIGFATDKGRNNNWKVGLFKQFLKEPDAQFFVSNFDDSRTERINAFFSDMQIAAVSSLAVYEHIKLTIRNSKTNFRVSIPQNTVNESTDIPSFTNAKWAQPEHSNNFSKVGQEMLGVKTIDEAVTSLKNGTMKSSALPVDYVVRDNQVYILNTRSSVTLTKANIDRSEWNWVDRTGQIDYEKRLNNQLKGSNGYTEVKNSSTGEVTKQH